MSRKFHEILNKIKKINTASFSKIWKLLFLQKFLRQSRSTFRNESVSRSRNLLHRLLWTGEQRAVRYATHNILRVSKTFAGTIGGLFGVRKSEKIVMYFKIRIWNGFSSSKTAIWRKKNNNKRMNTQYVTYKLQIASVHCRAKTGLNNSEGCLNLSFSTLLSRSLHSVTVACVVQRQKKTLLKSWNTTQVELYLL